MVEHVVEDDVVPLIALGEVFRGVVDDVVGADRSDQVYLGGAAHAGHFSAERLGDLHGKGADAAAGPVDQDFCPGCTWP